MRFPQLRTYPNCFFVHNNICFVRFPRRKQNCLRGKTPHILSYYTQWKLCIDLKVSEPCQHCSKLTGAVTLRSIRSKVLSLQLLWTRRLPLHDLFLQSLPVIKKQSVKTTWWRLPKPAGCEVRKTGGIVVLAIFEGGLWSLHKLRPAKAFVNHH